MRKIRITVLALVLAALCTATALAAGTQAVGDVNGSGDVNMTDMQCLYELLSTDKYSGSLTDEAGRRAADINGDGTVDILDYQRLYDILRQQIDYDNPVYEYDENGRAIRKCYYDATGKVNRYLVYEYGADGRKSAAVYYNVVGTALLNCTIECKSDGWEEWTYYDPETGVLISIEMCDANETVRKSSRFDSETGKLSSVSEFDEREREVDYKEYSDGVVTSHCSMAYDENGLRKQTYYDPATENVTWVEKYDEQGRTIDCKRYDDGKMLFRWTGVYDETGTERRTYYDTETGEITRIEKWEYDKIGRVTAVTGYKADGETIESYWTCTCDETSGARTITYRDSKSGKVSSVCEYSENGTLRKCTHYDRETGGILSVSEFDEQGREIGFKEFNNGTLSVHWSAVYDESGAEIRTYYDTVTGSVSNIEKREYDRTNKTCTITQYDVQTDKMYCVQVWEMNGEGDWKLIKTTDYGKVVRVWEYDEQGRKIDYKEYNGDEVSYHWTAVYDESGIETRTYYDAATGKVTCIEMRDANGTLRKLTEYNTDTGKAVCVREFDEKERMVGYKEFSGDTLALHCTAVYDESGAQIRTYYDTVTGSVSNIEKSEYDWTNKTCTITQYDVQTDKMYCVQVWEMNGEDDWKLLKETYYDENGNVTSETVY